MLCLRNFLHSGENLAVTVALGAMAVLPIAEIILRKFSSQGLSGATAIVQHLVLVSAMIGGVLAARDDRLLSLSTVVSFLKGRWKAGARSISGVFAVTVSSSLCIAGVQYVTSTREVGKILAYGVPVWVVQATMPVGFAIIAVRLLWRSSDRWGGRTGAFVLVAAMVAIIMHPPVPPHTLMIPALALLIIATILGAPIFTVLGGAPVILFWTRESPIASIAVDHYRMVVNPSLAAIPLFTLAGYFLAEEGASKRLIRVFQAIVGQIRGGPALVTALVCAFFTSFTGASGVTILALGGLLMPVLIADRFSERNALGLLTGAGSLGLLFPPCLPLILYAIIATNAGATVTIKEIFLGGIVPGLLLVGLTAWWGASRASADPSSRPSFDLKEAALAISAAKWELLLPVVALTTLFGGFATPAEAAAVTALYAFTVEALIYRDINIFRDTPKVMTECGLLVGGVLLILGVAMGFNNFLIDAQIPDQAVAWVKATIHSPLLFLLALNVLLLVVGCLMDIFSAIVVVVPLIIPMGLAYGIDPIHLGIIFLANLELGYLTPPVGMNLFLASYRFDKPLTEVYRSVIPMFLVLLAGVLLITYIPALTLTLPGWFE